MMHCQVEQNTTVMVITGGIMRDGYRFAMATVLEGRPIQLMLSLCVQCYPRLLVLVTQSK